MSKLRVNVNHNGKAYDKGTECPKELEAEFARQGLLEQEAPKAEGKKPAAKEPEGK